LKSGRSNGGKDSRERDPSRLLAAFEIGQLSARPVWAAFGKADPSATSAALNRRPKPAGRTRT